MFLQQHFCLAEVKYSAPPFKAQGSIKGFTRFARNKALELAGFSGFKKLLYGRNRYHAAANRLRDRKFATILTVRSTSVTKPCSSYLATAKGASTNGLKA